MLPLKKTLLLLNDRLVMFIILNHNDSVLLLPFKLNYSVPKYTVLNERSLSQFVLG